MIVQFIDHTFGVRPGTVGRKGEVDQLARSTVLPRLVLGVPESDKGGLVAPGFDDDDAGRNAMLSALLDFGKDALLRVPLVATDPRFEDPGWRKFWHARRLQEPVQDFVRRSSKNLDPNIRRGSRVEINLDPDPVWVRGADVEPDTPRRRDMKAPTPLAADYERVRHWQVRAPALALVLFEHDRVEPSSALVDAVEALAKSNDVIVRREPERES